MGGHGVKVEGALRTLFRRCVGCPDAVLECPACPRGQSCILTSKTCDECPGMKCVPDRASGAAAAGSGSSRGPNVGAIAGGVVGGVVFVAVVTWLVWRFFIKHRRQHLEDEHLAGEDFTMEKADDSASRRNDRASVRTVGSTASTAFTRASNVIQIAYIPGVTNRSPPSTPGLLVPPVPPLPCGSGPNSAVSTPNLAQDQHFFMPELRESTYSGVSESTFARDSVTPSLARSSVATTIYRNNAVVNAVPAQTVIRGKAAVVSVKSGGQSREDSPATTPPLPTIDYERFGQKAANVKEPLNADQSRPPASPAFSIGSTFLKSTANTARGAVPRPISVRKTSKSSLASANSPPRVKSQTTLTPSSSAASKHSRARRFNPNSAHLEDLSSDEDEPGARARKSLIGHDRDSQHTVIDDTPTLYQSPFSDTHAMPPSPQLPLKYAIQPSTPASGAQAQTSATDMPGLGVSSASGRDQSSDLSAVIEEATMRASRLPTHGGLGSGKPDPSPFSDANEVDKS